MARKINIGPSIDADDIGHALAERRRLLDQALLLNAALEHISLNPEATAHLNFSGLQHQPTSEDPLGQRALELPTNVLDRAIEHMATDLEARLTRVNARLTPLNKPQQDSTIGRRSSDRRPLAWSDMLERPVDPPGDTLPAALLGIDVPL